MGLFHVKCTVAKQVVPFVLILLEKSTNSMAVNWVTILQRTRPLLGPSPIRNTDIRAMFLGRKSYASSVNVLAYRSCPEPKCLT